MSLAERRHQRFAEFVVGAPQRIDHYQVVTPDVQAATDGTDELWGSWMEVKGNTHDLVFTNGRGPRLHHFAFTVAGGSSLLHAAGVAATSVRE